MNHPLIVSTEGFSARPWDPDADAEGAFAMYGDPDVVRYIGNRRVADVDDQRERLRAVKAR